MLELMSMPGVMPRKLQELLTIKGIGDREQRIRIST